MMSDFPLIKKTTRLSKSDIVFIEKLANEMEVSFSEALRFCISIARIVAEGKALLTYSPEFVKEIMRMRVCKK